MCPGACKDAVARVESCLGLVSPVRCVRWAREATVRDRIVFVVFLV